MALPHLDFDASDQGTLVAVVAGAVLAIVGGFVSGRLENIVARRDRERSAALMFGEILTALRIIIEFADRARGHGDPYGPVTLRMIKAAQREAATYDRNREALFDLSDAQLRARIHVLLVRLTLSFDGVMDATDYLERLDLQDAKNADLLADRRALYTEDRQGAFDFALELTAEIPALLTALSRITRYDFDAHDTVARETFDPAPEPIK
jgi:hypothetical protein